MQFNVKKDQQLNQNMVRKLNRHFLKENTDDQQAQEDMLNTTSEKGKSKLQ